MGRAHIGSAALALAVLLLSCRSPIAADLPPAFAGVWSDGGCGQDSHVRLVNALGILEFRDLAGERQVQLALIQDATPTADGRTVAVVLESPAEERLFEQQLTLAGSDRLGPAYPP